MNSYAKYLDAFSPVFTRKALCNISQKLCRPRERYMEVYLENDKGEQVKVSGMMQGTHWIPPTLIRSILQDIRNRVLTSNVYLEAGLLVIKGKHGYYYLNRFQEIIEVKTREDGKEQAYSSPINVKARAMYLGLIPVQDFKTFREFEEYLRNLI